MTDQELKDLVASLAIAQRKTDEQLAQTEATIAKQQAKTEAAIADLFLSQKKTDEQLAKTDAQLAKTDAYLTKVADKVDKLAQMYGGVANNQGAVAEEFYYNSLKHKPVLQGIHFDFVDKNIARSYQGLEDEYDILLLNGQDVFVIEVKYKAHPRDLERLIQKKAVNFKKLFPHYRNHKLHLGLASFHLDEEIKASAMHQGVTLLQRKGDLIETLPDRPLH